MAVVAVVGVASLAFYHAVLGQLTTSWIGNSGDPEQQIWFMGWVAHCLVTLREPFVSHQLLYPAGSNMMWNTSTLFPALVMVPVTLLGGPILSFNVLIILAPPLNAAAAYLAIRRWVHTDTAAALGAVAFAVSPFLDTQSDAGHPQLFLAALLPVVALVVDELLVRQKAHWLATGAALGVAGALQLLTGEEVLTFELLGVMAATVVLVVAHRRVVRAHLPYALRGLAAAAVAFVVLAGVPLYVQFEGPYRTTGATHPAALYSMDLLNFVQPFSQALHLGVLSHAHFLAGPGESDGYLGFAVLLAAALAVVLPAVRRRPIVPVALVLLLAAAVGGLGPVLRVDDHAEHVHLPWYVAEHLPILKDVIPGRFGLLLGFAGAILLAAVADAALESSHAGVRVAGVALVLVAIATWLPSPQPVDRQTLPVAFTTGDINRGVPDGSVVVTFPYITSADRLPMIWQGMDGTRFRMVDGWIITPGDHAGPTTALSTTSAALEGGPVTLTSGLRADVQACINDERISRVIVGPDPAEGRAIAFYSAFFGRPPSYHDGTVNVWVARKHPTTGTCITT